MNVVRCRVVVSGRVQGVFFRAACEREANRLRVKGWVRNRPDGSVEVVAEGKRDAVGELIAWCREGPPNARVDQIDITDESPRAERTFRVRY